MPGHVTGHSRGVQVATGREWRYQEERLWWWHLVCHGQMQQLQGVLADRRLPESGASRFACGGDYQMIVSIQFSSFACLHRNHWGIYTQKDFPLMYLPDTKQCTVVERVSFRLTTSYKRPHHISLLFFINWVPNPALWEEQWWKPYWGQRVVSWCPWTGDEGSS